MSNRLSRRLTKIECWRAEKERREKLAHCNCRYAVLALSGRPEEFEAEMNLPCPAHGLRNLQMVGGYGAPPPDTSRIDELIAIYEQRLARQKSEADTEEF